MRVKALGVLLLAAGASVLETADAAPLRPTHQQFGVVANANANANANARTQRGAPPPPVRPVVVAPEAEESANANENANNQTVATNGTDSTPPSQTEVNQQLLQQQQEQLQQQQQQQQQQQATSPQGAPGLDGAPGITSASALGTGGTIVGPGGIVSNNNVAPVLADAGASAWDAASSAASSGQPAPGAAPGGVNQVPQQTFPGASPIVPAGSGSGGNLDAQREQALAQLAAQQGGLQGGPPTGNTGSGQFQQQQAFQQQQPFGAFNGQQVQGSGGLGTDSGAINGANPYNGGASVSGANTGTGANTGNFAGNPFQQTPVVQNPFSNPFSNTNTGGLQQQPTQQTSQQCQGFGTSSANCIGNWNGNSCSYQYYSCSFTSYQMCSAAIGNAAYMSSCGATQFTGTGAANPGFGISGGNAGTIGTS